MLFFTLTKLVLFVLTCAQAMACIKWKRLFMMDVKASKDKTLADGLIERTSSMLDNIESKTVHKDEEGH